MYLLIVSGLSGAGKSLCLNCLEEQGYFCVDNLPSPLLGGFVLFGVAIGGVGCASSIRKHLKV